MGILPELKQWCLSCCIYYYNGLLFWTVLLTIGSVMVVFMMVISETWHMNVVVFNTRFVFIDVDGRIRPILPEIIVTAILPSIPGHLLVMNVVSANKLQLSCTIFSLVVFHQPIFVPFFQSKLPFSFLIYIHTIERHLILSSALPFLQL